MEWSAVLPFLTMLILMSTSDGRSPPMCEYEGSYYHDGETVTMQCTTVKCFRGRRWRVVNAECLFKDTCLKDGETAPAGECQSVQCKVNARKTKSKLLYKLDCPWKGGCKKNRDSWMDGCIKYQCRVKQNTAKVVVAKKSCEWQNDKKCYRIGSRKIVSCMMYQCQEDSNGAIGFKLVRAGCSKVGSRGCAKPKEQWSDPKTCRYFMCVISTDDSGNVSGTRTEVEQGCAGINKPRPCHEVGDTWMEYSRKTLQGCQKYKCTDQGPKEMISEGACYHDGQCVIDGEELPDDPTCFCIGGQIACAGLVVTARATMP